MSRRRAAVVLAVALASLLCAGALPAQDGENGDAQLEIIQLKHRLFDELRPSLEPLLEPGGTLTGSGDKLIVRTSATNLAEIRAALAALDQRAQRLRVSVSQSRSGDRAYADYGVDASIGGRDVGVGIGRPPGGPGSSVDARIASTQRRDEGTQLQSVLTVDGGSAWVNVVDARPQPYVSQQWTPYGPVVQEGLDWQQAQSGFFVTPRLRGDEVQIEISSQQQRFTEDRGGRLTTSGVDTVVSGRLGEWLPLGDSAETTIGAQGELLAHTRRRTSAYSGFWVRVDLMP